MRLTISGLASALAESSWLRTVAGAVLDTIERENLPVRIRTVGDRIKRELSSWVGRGPVRDVRGFGLIIGIELDQEIKPLLARLSEAGLIAVPAGLKVIRLLPAYTVSDGEVDRALEILRHVVIESPPSSGPSSPSSGKP